MVDDLPVGWLNFDLGKVATRITKGSTPTTYGYQYQSNGIKFIKVENVIDGIISLSSIKHFISDSANANQSRSILIENDVLFSIAGTIGETAVVDKRHLPANTNQAFAIISTDFRILTPHFLNYQLKSYASAALKGKARGGAMFNISLSDIKSVPIVIPPLNEQKRIVDKIEQLFSNIDEGVSLLKKVQQQLNVYRQSVLKAAVTGELTKDWREANKHRLEPGDVLLKRILKARREQWSGRGQYKEPVAPDTSNLPKLPDEWVWISVEQVLIEGLSNGRSVPDAAEGFPVLRLTALKNGLIDIYERKIGAWSPEEAAPFVVKFEDFLVSRGNGSKHLVGRGGLISINPDPVAYPDTLIRIRTNPSYVNKKFFSYVWNSFLVRQQIEAKAKTTAGIYKINQGDICSFSLPLPHFDEQGEIVSKIDDIFSQIDALEQWCASELTRSATLRQSILKDAFTGKLVPQDPTDEPASELLKRIQAERSDAQKAPKQKSPSTTSPRRGRPRKNS